MENLPKKVLFVNSEMLPYTPETKTSKICRFLPQGALERGRDIRSFMPKWGCINERKNQLHEVIRLSGINISIGDVDRPLIIKVAAISPARIQVYFIDNDELFKGKSLSFDEDGNFLENNAERAIFYARSVLETVKKLRWEPDIIHCQGWMTHLLPMYLKKIYKDDPIFSNSKVVLSLYNDISNQKFTSNFNDLALITGLNPEDTADLKDTDAIGLAKLAIKNSDGIILGEGELNSEILEACKNIPTLEYDAESIENDAYIQAYNDFYDTI